MRELRRALLLPSALACPRRSTFFFPVLQIGSPEAVNRGGPVCRVFGGEHVQFVAVDKRAVEGERLPKATDDLVGRQVVVVTGFEPIRVGGFRSDVLVIGALTDDGVVLISPDRSVAPGRPIA